MAAYYNEIDAGAAAWLRELIKQGLIADGTVDTRSITEVQPADLKGYTQCHFFAGIGVWSYALRSAGWPDSRPVWTGSCPCQPFSSAGKRKGKSDERHLWPAMFRLIRECRPPVVFGEQVASADGLDWLDAVSTDLESADYATGAADLCAAGVGAPHLRQRLYWVADTDGGRQQKRGEQHGGTQRPEQPAPQRHDAGRCGEGGGLADAHNARQQGDGLQPLQRGRAGDGEVASVAGLGAVGGVADTTSSGLTGTSGSGSAQELGAAERCVSGGPRTPDGMWAAPDWLWCRDGRWRPVEPGTFPLVDGASARVGRLRGYGNAIVAPVAETFIKAYLMCGA